METIDLNTVEKSKLPGILRQLGVSEDTIENYLAITSGKPALKEYGFKVRGRGPDPRKIRRDRLGRFAGYAGAVAAGVLRGSAGSLSSAVGQAAKRRGAGFGTQFGAQIGTIYGVSQGSNALLGRSLSKLKKPKDARRAAKLSAASGIVTSVALFAFRHRKTIGRAARIGFGRARAKRNYARTYRRTSPMDGLGLESGKVIPGQYRFLEWAQEVYGFKHPGHPNQKIHGTAGHTGAAGGLAGIAIRRAVRGVAKRANRTLAGSKREQREGYRLARKVGLNKRDAKTAARGGLLNRAIQRTARRIDRKIGSQTGSYVALRKKKEYGFKHPGHSNQKMHGKRGGSGKYPSQNVKRALKIGAAVFAAGTLLRAASLHRAKRNPYPSRNRMRRAKVPEWAVQQSTNKEILTKEYAATAMVFKEEHEGQEPTYRWVLLSSNGFRDRDGEIISTKALQRDVALWELEGRPAQPLRWWHVNLDDSYQRGVELGTTDFRMMHGRTLIESGTFLTKEIAEGVYNAQEKLAGSIGFRYSPKDVDDDKVFSAVTVFERSLLPLGKNSNLLTALAVV